MKRIRTLVLSFLFACAVLFVPFAVNAGYGIQNVAAAEEDESTTDYSTKYVVLSLRALRSDRDFISHRPVCLMKRLEMSGNRKG